MFFGPLQIDVPARAFGPAMRSTSIVAVAGLGSLLACELVAVLGNLLARPSIGTLRPAIEPAAAPVIAPTIEAAAPKAPAPAAPQAPAPVAPRAPVPVAPPARHIAPPVTSMCAPRIPLDDDTRNSSLPPLHPKRYAAWLLTRSPEQQERITARCRAHPVDYDRMCGGIGPLHIPMPPCIFNLPGTHKVPASPYATDEEWRAALTPEQRRYIVRHCPHDEGRPSSDLCGPNTPLVVAFDNQPVAFSAGGSFAFTPGAPSMSDFPTAATPWLALDRDHNGAIDSGAELFGSDTRLADGTTARNGFVALADLDANHDGQIDARDPAFRSLVLWADHDQNRRSDPGELRAVGSVIVSISLDHHVDLRCDVRSNCEGERAALIWRDARGTTHEGSIVDVYLPRR
jgi:hypothetical protein